MKYFVATLYLAAGIILPLFYINIVEADKILNREWILILALFIFCTIAGINWLFSIKENNDEEPAPKTKPSPFKTATRRKIPQPAPDQGKVVTAPRSVGPAAGGINSVPMISGRYVEPPAQKPRPINTTSYPPPMDKPDIQTLLEDVKNFIKLESWLMALQKANEMIHYYPDSPETDKVRANINFLIQKVKGHE